MGWSFSVVIAPFKIEAKIYPAYIQDNY